MGPRGLSLATPTSVRGVTASSIEFGGVQRSGLLGMQIIEVAAPPTAASMPRSSSRLAVKRADYRGRGSPWASVGRYGMEISSAAAPPAVHSGQFDLMTWGRCRLEVLLARGALYASEVC